MSPPPLPPPPPDKGSRWTRPRTVLLLLALSATTLVFIQRENNRPLPTRVTTEATPDPPPTFDILDATAATAYPAHEISNVSRASLIPHLILRTWKTASLSQIQRDSEDGRDHSDRFTWLKSWTALNPSATQIILDDDGMDRLVRGAFSKRVVEAYFKLTRIVLRADFARYMMLYEFGGYYTDMDTSCSAPIHHWNLGMNQAAVIIGVENPSEDKDSYLQWTMASAPHHPLIANVIHRVTEKIHATNIESLQNDDNAVLDVTGPGIWKTVIQEYLQAHGINLKTIANMWDGYQLIGDILILGKSYLNNDNSDNPKSLIRHHFTGFSEFGWRVHGKTVEQKVLSSANENYDFAYYPPKDLIELNPSSVVKQIPERIVQVANTADPKLLSERFRKFREEWGTFNPGYEMRLMSDSDMDEFVRIGCKKEEKETYFKFPLLRQRVEFFRYLALSHIGGVFTDIDTSPRVPVKTWIGDRNNVGIVIGISDQAHPQGPGFITSTIASIPHHPIIEAFISRVINQIQTIDAQTLKHASFFDLFIHSFNQHVQSALTQEGFNITRDFRGMSWEGVASSRDVVVLGQERFHCSHGRSKLMYVDKHNDMWGDEKGVWREDAETVSME
ncbi:membrane-bound alpha-1,6- mannosyltransferase Initiation-specific [Rhizoclosmatium sp. JEL0117]|nr:membrane-bound alpha-1,6- mannosyltransferase Initiation-specific [Rhizoclosmatium sp. JEL0117]